MTIAAAINAWYEQKHPSRFFPKSPADFAKKISKDKPPIYENGSYIIFANNSRWRLEMMITWKLYWVPQEFGDNYSKIVSDNLGTLECQTTWLTDSRKISDIKKIINNHPNLRRK